MKTVTIPIPHRGQSDGLAVSEQPPLSTPLCLNVLPIERVGRRRIGQRPGMTAGTALDTETDPVQAILPCVWLGELYVVAVCDGNVYVNGEVVAGETLPGTGDISLCQGGGGKVYLVDGTTVLVLTLAASSSIDELGTAPSDCTLCAFWRGRLVLAGPKSIWYMSRQDDVTDWDYAPTDMDSGRAVSSSATSMPGRISGPITALAVANDDNLLISESDRIWHMRGDPATGGDLLLLGPSRGFLDAYAHCIANDGSVWFADSSGICRFDGAGIQPVTGHNARRFFTSIDTTAQRVFMVWDHKFDGAWVFAAKASEGYAVYMQHAFVDGDGGFWPMQFTSGFSGETVVSTKDPMCAASTPARLYLGCRDGLVRGFDDAQKKDDGYTIISRIYLGPFDIGGPLGESIILMAAVELGQVPTGFSAPGSWGCTLTIQVANSPYDAVYSPTASVAGNVVSAGRLTLKSIRIKGRWMSLKIENVTADKFWSFDNAAVIIESAGRQR